MDALGIQPRHQIPDIEAHVHQQQVGAAAGAQHGERLLVAVGIRIIRKEKKPISASVTAAIAAIRAAPSDFRKSKKPCTGFRPNLLRRDSAVPGKICPVYG
jgi:hypothetical protein